MINVEMINAYLMRFIVKKKKKKVLCEKYTEYIFCMSQKNVE